MKMLQAVRHSRAKPHNEIFFFSKGIIKSICVFQESDTVQLAVDGMLLQIAICVIVDIILSSVHSDSEGKAVAFFP